MRSMSLLIKSFLETRDLRNRAKLTDYSERAPDYGEKVSSVIRGFNILNTIKKRCKRFPKVS